MSLLEAHSLVKIYGRRTVVNQASFEVNPGEIVGLLGPNGAGKTTSFRMVVGLIRPNRGKIFFRGEDISRLSMYRRARKGIGYLSQEPSIFQRLTVRKNVLAVLEYQPLRRRERHRRADELLAELGLERLAKEKAYTLSGGERRRLEICRALVTNPQLILLDEPFSGVDPIAVEDIQGIIMNLKRRGLGILLTDHSVRETLSVTNRSYIMHNGEILRHGTPEELVRDKRARDLYLGHKFEM